MRKITSVKNKKSGSSAIVLRTISNLHCEVILTNGEISKVESSTFDWESKICSEDALEHNLSKEQIIAWTRYIHTGQTKSLANKKMGVRIPSMNKVGSSEIKYRDKFEFNEGKGLYGVKGKLKKKKILAQMKKTKK